MRKTGSAAGHAWAPRVERLTRQLVSIPSVVNTPGEADAARFIRDELAALPYFQANPDCLLLEATREDSRERYNVIAFVRGRQAPAEDGAAVADRAAVPADTCLMMCHLDTVGIKDYGPFVDLAFRPDDLAAVLGTDPGYLAGRGALDTKAGIAMHMAVLERFASGDGDQRLSLLFVATADEEDTSRGILSFLAMLPELESRWGMRLRGAINANYMSGAETDLNSRYVYAGTTGKLLPSLFVAGAETHAVTPFAGFDPNWLVAEVLRRVNYNPALCDTVLGELVPPPVSLKLTDMKETYSIQTALYAWAYFNWFTYTRGPGEVLSQFRAVVEGAFADLCREHSERTRQCGVAGERVAATWTPRVYTYGELSDLVARRLDPSFEQAEAEWLMKVPGIDLRSFSYRLTEAMWRASGLPGPAAVVGFAHIYYPPGPVQMEDSLLAAMRTAAERVGRELGLSVKVRYGVPHISDLAFLGCPDLPGGLEALEENSPGWGWLYRVDHAAHARLNLPVVNIGPWGDGTHTRRERVEKAYSFGVAPELIWQTLQECAKRWVE